MMGFSLWMARAKGLRERRVVAVHALRNALLPLLTVPSVPLTTALVAGWGPVVVAATLDFSSAILTTAGPGFLGLGAQP